MPLLDQVQRDMTGAMKTRDELRLSALRMLKTALKKHEIDAMKRTIRIEIEDRIRHDPENVKQYLRLMAISRNLERIADLATNIGEDVIYLAQGKIIRHGEIG